MGTVRRPAEVMLRADRTCDEHPWHAALGAGASRGLAPQLLLLGIDPDDVQRRAHAHGAAVITGATTRRHGWRELLVRDPDGYERAVGVLVEPARGPCGPRPVA
jgi:hypothetical protein